MRRRGGRERPRTPQCEFTQFLFSTPSSRLNHRCELCLAHVSNSLFRLRLKIYRSLGIDLEADENGNYKKAIIRNSRKGDVHVVNIDPKFSRFFYANYFWQNMQG